MKKVLFVSITEYDFKNEEKVAHLKEKFEGLAKGAKVCVIGRGRPFNKKKWGCKFYLLPNRFWFNLFVLKRSFAVAILNRVDLVIAQSPLVEGWVGV